MNLYITFNDQPSGIYASQVIDVVKFVRENANCKLRLLAFISIRDFYSNKQKIKSQLSDAIVLPMVPKLKNWKMNVWLLKIVCLILRPDLLVCRSVMATNLGLMCKKSNKLLKVVYDGRGAITDEWKRYGVVKDKDLLKHIAELERKAVIEPDFRISVSEALMDYWKADFKYSGSEYVIIPCTINRVFENIALDQNNKNILRQRLGFNNEDIVLVYSGSTAGWQSFDILFQFITACFNRMEHCKVLFLSHHDEGIDKLKQAFPGKIYNLSVNPEEVGNYLSVCDYGLLIRENSITNKVASPVKFAEYLACGLKVIISDSIGDYSALTEDQKLGYIYRNQSQVNLDVIESIEKLRVSAFAKSKFVKSNYVNEYRKVFAFNEF